MEKFTWIGRKERTEKKKERKASSNEELKEGKAHVSCEHK